MPYKSLKQERFFHTDTARKKGITPEVVKEFDTASKGMNLPDHTVKAGKSGGKTKHGHDIVHY